MPQIMESRLIPGPIFATDASLGTESLEVALQKAAAQPGARLANKKGCVAALRVPCLFLSFAYSIITLFSSLPVAPVGS